MVPDNKGITNKGETMSKWSNSKSKDDVIDELYRLSHLVMGQGDVDCLVELIPFSSAKRFVDGWHEEDYLDEEDEV